LATLFGRLFYFWFEDFYHMRVAGMILWLLFFVQLFFDAVLDLV
jgi:hypothetical protein